MNKTLPTLLLAAAASIVTIVAPVPVLADSKDETLEPDKGANPDQTTRDRYQTAMASARETLKMSLAQCEPLAASDRAACERQARDNYDNAMAAAGDFLHRPRADGER